MTDNRDPLDPCSSAVDRARDLADQLLFPTALATDRAAIVPRANLDALATAGLYGLQGPRSYGGLEVGSDEAADVTEVLSGGCLTTAFVWTQHHSAVRTITRGSPALRDRWLYGLCSGDLRAGVAFASLRRPGPPELTVVEHGKSLILDGAAPFVTGWERINVVHVAARDQQGRVIWMLMDAGEVEGLSVAPLPLAAVNASGTVRLEFQHVAVPADRVTLVEEFTSFIERDTLGLAPNGAHAIGVSMRALSIAANSELALAVADCRRRLRMTHPLSLAPVRAEASELALRAATFALVSEGGTGMIDSSHAQRLCREALFLMVFGQTQSIKNEEVRLLTESLGSR